MATDKQAREALDRHITGNYGEDQFTNYDEGRRKLYDVTCVIGTVYEDLSSPLTAHEAAFLMVCRHDAPGTFSWTDNDGYTYSVTVERQDPPKDAEAS